MAALGRLLGLSWEALGTQNGVQEGEGHWGKAVFNAVSSFSWLQCNFPSIWEGLGKVLGGFFEGDWEEFGEVCRIFGNNELLALLLGSSFGSFGDKNKHCRHNNAKSNKLHVTP